MFIGKRYALTAILAMGSLIAAASVPSVDAQNIAPKLRRRAESSSSTASREEKKSLTVMTRNMYVGFSLDVLFSQGPLAVLTQFQETKFQARVGALATEICAKKPDLIGLQEVSTIQVTGTPGVNFGLGLGEPLEFLAVLLMTISTICDISYSPANVSTNVEFEIPVVGLGLAQTKDEDVILVKTGDPSLEVIESASGHFVDILQAPLPQIFGGGFLPFKRSWQYIDVTLDGTPFRFANTHLETSAPFNPLNEPYNLAQAQEFITAVVDTTPEDYGLIAVGDFNCIPSSDTFEVLSDALSDAWEEVNDDDSGFTCCQAAALDNDITENEARIDYVFYRDSEDDGVEFDVDAAELVGAQIFQDEAPYWASDHAGVVSSFKLE